MTTRVGVGYCTPVCGNGVREASENVPSAYQEECDDGNNTDNDFCAADCVVELSDAGGGSTGGGGNSPADEFSGEPPSDRLDAR